MASPQRRTTPAASPAGALVDIGNLEMYSSGQFIPDGDYILSSLDVQMYAGKTPSARASRLGVMVTFLPLDSPTEDHKLTQFYSMGSKADQSFAPNPETGKSIITIPGAPATNLNDKTNWYLFYKSLRDSGLPAGVLVNDVSVVEGAWVHITNIEEPADRGSFASGTAEVQQAPRTPGKVPIVTEIKEGGAPWEGGGGTPAVKTTAKPITTRAVPKPNGAPAPPAPAPASAIDDDLRVAAINGISDVLTKKPNGCPRLALRTDTFKAVKSKLGEEVATSVVNNFFEAGHEDDLSSVLGEIGYTVINGQVKPAA
jgi:hypothetical protein